MWKPELVAPSQKDAGDVDPKTHFPVHRTKHLFESPARIPLVFRHMPRMQQEYEWGLVQSLADKWFKNVWIAGYAPPPLSGPVVRRDAELMTLAVPKRAEQKAAAPTGLEATRETLREIGKQLTEAISPEPAYGPL